MALIYIVIKARKPEKNGTKMSKAQNPKKTENARTVTTLVITQVWNPSAPLLCTVGAMIT